MGGNLEFDKADWIAGLEKGLRIIEAFSDAHPRLTPSTCSGTPCWAGNWPSP